MKFFTRKLIKPEDLNDNNTLFGGSLLRWIDEEAAIFTMVHLNTRKCVTKIMSEIDFINAPHQGDIIEIGIEAIAIGRTSITLACEVRNKVTLEPILSIEKIVFVNVDEHGKPKPHGKTL